MGVLATRFALIDALKAVASQLIVLHHLAFYGPMSDLAQQIAPALMHWLSQDARMAVQVFLVVGGFLAARSLAPGGVLVSSASPWALLRSRYLKLVPPYAVALVLGMACAALARAWMTHNATPAAPGGWQFVVHLLLLHDILAVEALSAGVWYVAIDFQLFALLVGVLWLARDDDPHAAASAEPVPGSPRSCSEAENQESRRRFGRCAMDGREGLTV